MKKIIECVPNFSEGKDKKVIRNIEKTIESVPGILLLNLHADIDHNRSVITFAGEPKAVLEAAFKAVKKAAELIDMEKHRGAHPRKGATDVLPLIPLKGVSIEKCIEYAKILGKRIGKELQIPVYLYEKAAQKPERKNLENIRGKDYEENPDFGPKKAGKAGATTVGVRDILIAYNVNLKTDNTDIARKIAKKIREKDGGLKSLKALGIKLKSRKIAQVSMNLTNYKNTPPLRAFKAIEKEAKKYGTEILESEIIGLIPRDALPKNPKKKLKIKNFKKEQILELALEKKILQNLQ